MLIPLSYICLWVKSLVAIYGSLSHSWYSWMLIPLSYICLWVKSLVPMVAEVMVFMDAYSPQLYMLMGQKPGAYLW